MSPLIEDVLSVWPILLALIPIIGQGYVQLHKMRQMEEWVRNHRHDENGEVYMKMADRSS